MEMTIRNVAMVAGITVAVMFVGNRLANSNGTANTIIRGQFLRAA